MLLFLTNSYHQNDCQMSWDEGGGDSKRYMQVVVHMSRYMLELGHRLAAMTWCGAITWQVVRKNRNIRSQLITYGSYLDLVLYFWIKKIKLLSQINSPQSLRCTVAKSI